MFRAKTVFILGAGSSFEVGLPLGNQLKIDIANKLDFKFDWPDKIISGDPALYHILNREFNPLRKQQDSFKTYISASQELSKALPLAISIDNLLFTHKESPQSQICGKLGIVKRILEAERESDIYINKFEQEKIDFSILKPNWLSQFTQLVTEDVDKSSIDSLFENVAFINFNYDRCVDHFLFEALQIYYNLSTTETTDLIQKLNILHPYGSVGTLPQLNSSNDIQVDFGSEGADILNITNQIKTFNERNHEPEELHQIHETLNEAEIIVFLGFAFHKQNLELMTSKNECKTKKVYATAYGISENDCQVIETDIRNLLNQRQKNRAQILLKSNLTCEKLLTEFWRSLSANV